MGVMGYSLFMVFLDGGSMAGFSNQMTEVLKQL
jgi:hypothetical protein